MAITVQNVGPDTVAANTLHRSAGSCLSGNTTIGFEYTITPSDGDYSDFTVEVYEAGQTSTRGYNVYYKANKDSVLAGKLVSTDTVL